ncbi:MAG: cytochrome c [Deltaproteobacteria bacterium]|nr:cytochrome c [Deltaproteobacteria bacterium]
MPWIVLPLIPLLALADQPSMRLSDHDEGQLLYQRHCAACHGAVRAGDGPAAEALRYPVPDLRARLSVDVRESLVPTVLLGQGAMPGFDQSLDRAQVRRILRYMEALPMEPPTATPEEVPEVPAEEVPEVPAEAPPAPERHPIH